MGLWIALFPFLIFFCSWPINSLRTRTAIVVTLAGLILGSLVFAWRSRKVLACLIIGYVLVVVFLLLPGRPLRADELQSAYTNKLLSYEGVPYVWGGEGRWGMDCSGIIRRSMVDVLLEKGLKTAIPGLFARG